MQLGQNFIQNLQRRIAREGGLVVFYFLNQDKHSTYHLRFVIHQSFLIGEILKLSFHPKNFVRRCEIARIQ